MHLKTYRKPLIIITCAIVFLLLLAFGGYTLMNARNFQLFGKLVSRIDTSEKVIALTFDDGPTQNTTAILNILKSENIKATFMLEGRQIDANPQLAKNIVQAGHELGNHSYSHQRMVLKSPSFYKEEIEKTDSAIRNSGYKGEISFRPPNGKKLIGLPLYLAQHNRTTVMWDVEPEHAGSSTQDIVAATLRDTRPGSIILLHAMYGSRETSLAAIKPVIEGLKERGYRFVTVAELLKLQNNNS